ncbi:secretory phospholipase A2 receptor-like isoform X1 [Oncorhynchus tshawytscha]|uniref:Secretory phospholipase A2 receptor-like n=1 Tax=Oncorhynchus tshawytscha TaxID=74940 RepID=A0A8C8M7I8_ONCTS|nr:secretory phospholipase A2 receptor-like isoform X1 [Oncorhynchus tshawytscha]XP_042167523.1 secretory phospholipase A2 receptor-like isoform X1 [Oncorhynchus tshawytscha]
MIQPVLLLLLLAAMSSPVFGTEISVLEGTSVTLVCTYLGDKKFETCWGRYCGLYQCTDPIMEDKSKYKINAEVGTMNLTILKLQPTDRGSYCCRVYVPGWFNDLKQFYSLKVVKGCVRDLLDKVHFLENNIANQPFTTKNASQCRQECTKNDTCQYFTFVDENAGIIVHRNKCFLKASTGHTPEITIQHLQHATSGYSLRNCSGKVTYSVKKYSLVPEKKNWTEAQEYCRQHYTNLAIIHTEEDWKAIQSSLGNFSGDVWIGLHRSDPTEKWKWSDGEDFMFFNWEKGFGVHTEGHDCVLSISSHWQPVNCAALSQYMCQQVRHGNGTTEKVYELMPGAMMWQDAVTDCRTIKGRELASICNQKEQEAFDELTTVATWIGLKHNNKRWEWSNREPFPESEPTWVGRNCQQLNSDRKCTPKDCSNQSAFFCYGDERPLNTTGDTTTPVTPETTSPTSTGPPSIKTSTTTTNTLLPTTINGQSNTSPPTTTNGQSTTSPTTTTIGQSTKTPTTTTIGQSTTSTSSGQLTSLGPTSPDRKSTSSLSSTTSPLHPDYLTYFNESKSWINALEFCKSRRSNLVHITNQTVQADLTQLLANVELPCGGVWIGLERSIFEWSAPWLWTSGDVDKVVKYREWHNCFPLNPMNYHCGKMVRVGNRELKWLDASCHQELPFICQDLH